MTIRQFLMLCDTSRDGYRWNKLKIYDEFSMKSKEYWWHHDQAVRESSDTIQLRNFIMSTMKQTHLLL